jgi:hypothetical protein
MDLTPLGRFDGIMTAATLKQIATMGQTVNSERATCRVLRIRLRPLP